LSDPIDDNLRRTYSLAGRNALVTGGGSGLGLAIATCLAEAGARVAIASRRLGADGMAPHGLIPFELDLSHVDSVESTATEITEAFGPIDILVNNAGNTVKKPFEDSGIGDFDQVFDVHVRGALELSRHVIRGQIERGQGVVLFTSSMTAYIGQPNVLGYTIAKSAINGAVRGLSAEFAGRGVRVNGVAPGWIDTALFQQATRGDPTRREKILNRIPMGRLGTPEDIGWACAFLASPAARYITGQVLLVDGGGATGF
jgi:gluconate 5-dehydrogenase